MGVANENQNRVLFSSASIPSHTYTLLLKTHKNLFSQGTEVNASFVCVYIHKETYYLINLPLVAQMLMAKKFLILPIPFFNFFLFLIFLSNSKKPLGIFSLTNQLQHPPKKTMQFQERERLHRK